MRATTAIHPVAGDASALLKRAGAPADLVKAASGRSMNDVWDGCERPDWLLWLGVVEKIPLVSLVEATVAAVSKAVSLQPGDRGLLEEALAAAASMDSAERCRAAAEACDPLAISREKGGYRDATAAPSAWAARAAVDVARAADTLLGIEARRWAESDLAATGRATALGLVPSMISRGDFPPVRFDPDDELAWGCVYSLESAMEAAIRASIASETSPRIIQRITGDLADDAFEILDPVRDGLDKGIDAAALVRAVSPGAQRTTEAEDPAERPKQPLLAWAASFVIPFGGGHYYAEHPAVGGMLTLGTLAAVLWPNVTAVPLIVLGDAFLSSRALRRRNRGEIMSTPDQIVLGAVIVAVAHVIAAVVS